MTPLSASVAGSERRPRSPQVRRDWENEREGEREDGGDWLSERDKVRELRGMRIGTSPAPPPRSVRRPGSSSGRPPPVAIPPREGMI
jgi:hypothetical protein